MAQYRKPHGQRGLMEPVVSDRKSVAKRKAASQFNGQAQRTNPLNTAPAPMRGGIRL